VDRSYRFSIWQMAHELNHLPLFVAGKALDFIYYFCCIHRIDDGGILGFFKFSLKGEMEPLSRDRLKILERVARCQTKRDSA